LLGGDLSGAERDKTTGIRVSARLDVKGNGKTVVRERAGIYHDANLFDRLNERAYVGPSGNDARSARHVLRA